MSPSTSTSKGMAAHAARAARAWNDGDSLQALAAARDAYPDRADLWEHGVDEDWAAAILLWRAESAERSALPGGGEAPSAPRTLLFGRHGRTRCAALGAHRGGAVSQDALRADWRLRGGEHFVGPATSVEQFWHRLWRALDVPESLTGASARAREVYIPVDASTLAALAAAPSWPNPAPRLIWHADAANHSVCPARALGVQLVHGGDVVGVTAYHDQPRITPALAGTERRRALESAAQRQGVPLGEQWAGESGWGDAPTGGDTRPLIPVGAHPRCVHATASWSMIRDEGHAAGLWCPDCECLLAAEPLHRFAPPRVLHGAGAFERYLAREHFWAVIEGRDPATTPRTLQGLRYRDAIIPTNLVREYLHEHCPLPPPSPRGPSPSLRTILAGRVGGTSLRR